MSDLENRAKEFADAFYPHEFATEEILFTKADIRVAYKQGFEDATKWYYPSKGEYPTEGGKYFCCHKYNNNLIPTIGIYNIHHKSWCGESGIVWNSDPYAWQYPVLPKEETVIKCCENCGRYKNDVCEKTKTHPNKPKEWICLDWMEEP